MGGPKYPGTFPEYPGCYILRIRGCFIWTEETARAGSLATIRAPALEERACPRTRGTELLELDGCTSVRLRGKVCVRSHLRPWCDAGENDFAVELLRSCSSAHRLHVCLVTPPVCSNAPSPPPLLTLKHRAINLVLDDVRETG